MIAKGSILATFLMLNSSMWQAGSELAYNFQFAEVFRAVCIVFLKASHDCFLNHLCSSSACSGIETKTSKNEE
ncbi:hypothetical protein KC19_5G064800 [Ceratodon purpureus]|uniref:Secreted protein n=1 Tax=Ceratodon purpureus TaxID=3225 RepID=A0A8T0HYI9_CERPU|nr:hypothetical protein KC19_5G064800 [Ceratodon purpureus]